MRQQRCSSAGQLRSWRKE